MSGKIHRQIMKKKIKESGCLFPHRLYDEVAIEILEENKPSHYKQPKKNKPKKLLR